MKAKKKPISVTAIHYNKNISLNKLLELLSTNKEEPVRYDKNNKNIYIKKNVVKFHLNMVIGLFTKKIQTNVFGLLTMIFF